MDIKKVWDVFKNSSMNDKDMQRSFRKAATPNACIELLEEIETLKQQLETERLRLVACGVVANANTQETAKQAREMHDNYKSGSMDDVIRAVDSEMELRTRLATAKPEWVSIEDRLPSYDEAVLISDGYNIGHARMRKNIAIDFWEIVSSNHREPKRNVTHWMPLPQPPKEQGE